MKLIQFILLSSVLCVMAACHSEGVTVKDTTVQDSIPKNTTVPEATEEPSASSIAFNTYCNSRFSYCIDYPTALLIPQGEAGNGDGQAFKSSDGKATLLVYRDFRDNINPEVTFTLDGAYKEDLKTYAKDGKSVSYKIAKKLFYVISGTYKDKIFYQKTILSDESNPVTSLIEYNSSEKELYDPLCDRIFSSFK